MSEHARLSASSSAKWLNCPGSIKAEESYPNTSSYAAEEGTVAHNMAERVLTHGQYGQCDNVMFGHVMDYVSYVRLLMGISNPTFIETTVDYSSYAKDGFGTADAIIVDSAEGTLHILDLKYGVGRVSAINNSQLKLYALGFLSNYQDVKIDKIVLHIIQPRIPDGISTFEMARKELAEFGEYVRERSKLTLLDNPERIAGDKQCQWCRAKHECPALAEMLDATTLTDFSNIDSTHELPAVETLTDEQRKRVLDNKALITGFIKAVEASIYSDIESGKGFDGYKIVEGRAIRQWGGDADAILSAKLGSAAYTTKLIGLGAAEKLLSKKEVAALTVKPVGKPTLVKASDKREALDNAGMFEELN